MLFRRISLLINRKFNAKLIGVNFARAKNWKIPEHITTENFGIVKLKLVDDLGTRNAFIDIFLDDVYKLKSLKQENIKSILDIGGHAGLFSLSARIKFPKALIHTYEPNPGMAEIIQHQADVSSFKLFKEAVGSISGKVGLTNTEDSVMVQTVPDTNGEIAMTAFAECLKRIGNEIDLLKLDCEGAEWDIFKDRDQFRKVKFITMEYHITDEVPNADAVRKQIEQLGFTITSMTELGPTCGLLQAINKNLNQQMV